MSAHGDNSILRRRQALLVGSIVFLSFIYFYEGGGWNQNSRFDLQRAIVERHTLQIDAYHDNTGDVAHVNGHYYSDKAPGLVFLAVPFAEAARPMLRAAGIDPESPRGEFALSYLVMVFAVALPTALAGVCLFFLAMRFGCSSTEAALGAVLMCMGTPIWAYASLFWAHALVGSCLVFAFAAALKLQDGGHEFLWALAVGLAAGWATVTEYPAAPASVMLALLALSQVWPRGGSVRWRVVGGVGLGATVCLAVLLIYLYAAFGSIRPSYAYYDPNSFAFMRRQGYLGLTYPHPDRLLKLLFGCARGLFFASPVCLAAVYGLWRLGKEKAYRGPVLVTVGIAAYYFLFNASFYWWKSGLSFGPRYAGASIPLLCLGIAASLRYAGRVWRRTVIALGCVSIFIAMMAVSTTSQLSMQDPCPIVHLTVPEFLSGKMASNRVSMLTVAEAGTRGDYGAFNFGQLIGLRGLASLLPLMAIWILSGLWWWRIDRSKAVHGSLVH